MMRKGNMGAQLVSHSASSTSLKPRGPPRKLVSQHASFCPILLPPGPPRELVSYPASSTPIILHDLPCARLA